MNCAHTHPNTFIRYYTSDMVLHVDSDGAYLVAPKVCSGVTRYYHLSDNSTITKHPKFNGAILVECKTLRHVVSSSAEAEVSGIFHISQVSISIRTLLHTLNHPQPPIPLKTDNSTSKGCTYDNIHQRYSKYWNMRYYWPIGQ